MHSNALGSMLMLTDTANMLMLSGFSMFITRFIVLATNIC